MEGKKNNHIIELKSTPDSDFFSLHNFFVHDICEHQLTLVAYIYIYILGLLIFVLSSHLSGSNNNLFLAFYCFSSCIDMISRLSKTQWLMLVHTFAGWCWLLPSHWRWCQQHYRYVENSTYPLRNEFTVMLFKKAQPDLNFEVLD